MCKIIYCSVASLSKDWKQLRGLSVEDCLINYGTLIQRILCNCKKEWGCSL